MTHARSTGLVMLERFECGLQMRTQQSCLVSNTVIATMEGQWFFREGDAVAAIDRRVLVVGNTGDVFGSRNAPGQLPKGFALCLKDGAIEDGLSLFSRRVIDSGAIRRLFLRLAEAECDDEFDSLAFTIFTEASSDSLYPETLANRLRTERAKRYIERHAFESITLCEVACEIGLSPFTTIRQFKAATGRTPHAYLLEIRLDAAKRLLTGTNASVESIAKRVGFDDLAYFSRFFKRRTGITPSGFRAA